MAIWVNKPATMFFVSVCLSVGFTILSILPLTSHEISPAHLDVHTTLAQSPPITSLPTLAVMFLVSCFVLLFFDFGIFESLKHQIPFIRSGFLRSGCSGTLDRNSQECRVPLPSLKVVFIKHKRNSRAILHYIACSDLESVISLTPSP